MISEPQAALAIQHLIPALLPSFEAWLSARGGLDAFLDAMSKGGYERSLASAAVFNNHFERDRGMQLVEMFRSAQEIEGAALTRAVEGSGLSYRVLLQMLPFAALLLMGSLRIACDQPLREILSRRLGARAKAPADPFAELADLVSWEAKGGRLNALAGVLNTVFGQRARQRAAASPA